MKFLLIVLVLCFILVNKPTLKRICRRWICKLKQWTYICQKQYDKAATIVYEQCGPTSEAITLFTNASNNGSAQAMIHLAQVFEERDDPRQAAFVYNVLEERTQQLDPFLNAMVAERLEILQQPVRRIQQPVLLDTGNNTNVILNPHKPHTKTTIPSIKVTSDKHNVHDSGVIKSVAESYKKIKSNNHEKATDALIELRQLCESNKNALRVLDKIETSTTPITSLNDEKEIDVLLTVWNRIQTFDDKEKIKQNLILNLADCIDNNTLVCTNGRVARVMDTLNIIDPLVEIKPRWAIRREIMDLAAKMRDEYNELETFKQHLRNECKLRYVDTNLMTQKLLDAELNSWIDSI